MSGWEQTHRRYRLVYAVADDIGRRGDAAKAKWLPVIEAEFGGLEGFLLDIRRRWRTAVDARSDAPELQRTVARDNEPLLRLLEAFADHPVIAGTQGLQAMHAEPA
jgi:hypothetical protein